jgi:hypothetical protein
MLRAIVQPLLAWVWLERSWSKQLAHAASFASLALSSSYFEVILAI